MMDRPPAPLDDHVRALKALEPSDDATARRIAMLLGVEVEARVSERQEEVQRFRKQASAPPKPPQRRTRDAEEEGLRRNRTRRASALSGEGRTIVPPPAWLTSASRIERTPLAAWTGSGVPFTPLLEERWSRAVISGAVAALDARGPVDMDAVLENVVHGRILDHVPRSRVPTMAHGIDLLIDVCGGMEPFARDQADLTRRIMAVVGRERTRLLRFAGCPQRGAGGRLRSDWKPYEAPVAGTPVIVLSDLGIGELPMPGERATPGEWADFGMDLRRAGCPFLAFVPYDPERVSLVVRGVAKVLPWDHRTGVAEVRRIVGYGLKVKRA